MKQLTDLEKSSFRRLYDLPDGKVLLNYLRDNLEYQDRENRLAPVDTVQRGQGKAILLDELIGRLTQHMER